MEGAEEHASVEPHRVAGSTQDNTRVGAPDTNYGSYETKNTPV